MQFTYPAAVDTPQKRLLYIFKWIKKSRFIHNQMGKWKRGELTTAEYAALPNKLKAAYPPAPQLTDEQWQDFQHRFFDRLTSVLYSRRNALIDEVEAASSYDPDFDTDISE